MKKHLLLLLLSVYAFGQNPNPFPNGLKTTKIDTYASGVLPINGGVTVNSTTQAFVLPRMTTTQKNAITTPTTSALVYDTTLGKYQYWDGSAWVDFGGSIPTWQQQYDSGLTDPTTLDDGAGNVLTATPEFVFLTSAIGDTGVVTGGGFSFAKLSSGTAVSSDGESLSQTNGSGTVDTKVTNVTEQWLNEQPDLPLGTYTPVYSINGDFADTEGNVVVSGGGAVDSVNGQTGVVVLDADDISDTSTTNKWTNASEKATWNGKENVGNKQNSLATDGTGVKFPTVDAVNTALALKQDNPNVILSLTDYPTAASVTTLHVVSSHQILANTLSNNSILKYMTCFERTGTAGNSSMGIYLDTSPGTIGSAVSGTAVLIAAAAVGTTGRIPNFERTFKLASNLLTGFPSGVNSPTDAVVATSALTSTPLTPSTTYHLITAVINNSAATVITQRFTSLTQRK